MKNSCFYLTIFLLATMLFFSCKKNDTSNAGCSSDQITTRTIVDKQAIIKLVGETFYVAEQGSIDSRLVPCNLPKEYQVNNLNVMISGDVKATVQPGPGPCCSENFVISKISR